MSQPSTAARSDRVVEDVALEQVGAALERSGDELAAAGAEVVEDRDLDAVGEETVRQGAADEPGTAGDEGALHCAGC